MQGQQPEQTAGDEGRLDRSRQLIEDGSHHGRPEPRAELVERRRPRRAPGVRVAPVGVVDSEMAVDPLAQRLGGQRIERDVLDLFAAHDQCKPPGTAAAR